MPRGQQRSRDTEHALAFVLLCVACGSPPEARAPVAAPSATRAPSEPAAVETSSPPALQVRCAEPPCLSAVGLLAVTLEDEPERCTAALVGADRVITASHCIPAAMRAHGASCGGVFVGFPRTESEPEEWLECERVEGARALPALTPLQQDVALLRLRSPSARAPVAVDDSPLTPGVIVSVVSVDPHPIYATQHTIRAHLCRVGDADYAADAIGNYDARNVGWLAECTILPGNSGSAVLDREGRLRAVVHGGSGPNRQIGVTSEPRL